MLPTDADPSAPPSAALLGLEDVSKRFGNGTVALERLTLDVRTGEFLSLIGPSGCGKSTALRIMAGLVTPSSGRMVQTAAMRDSIGFVFQDPTLMPWASAFDNVWLPLRLRGVARGQARPRVDDALALVGLEGFGAHRPSELSGGMRMRVSIARALVIEPRLLLMDEPFAALDEITRFRLNDDLLDLKARLGATVVFVTHSVYESVYLADRIVVMAARPGRAVAELTVTGPARRSEAFRATPGYLEACRAASAALHDTMAPADTL